MAKQKKQTNAPLELNHPDVMHPDNSAEFAKLLTLSSLVRMLYKLVQDGKLRRVERTKPFQAVKTRKEPVLHDQVYEWVMYYFGKYNSPKWLKNLVRNFPLRDLTEPTITHRPLHARESVTRHSYSRDTDISIHQDVQSLMENDFFKSIAFSEVLPENTPNAPHMSNAHSKYVSYFSVVHIVLGVLHMNGQSPFKDGIKVFIENATRTSLAKVGELRPHLIAEITYEDAYKRIVQVFYTKKELHALLNCPHDFNNQALALQLWAFGENVSTKSYLKRFCEYSSRLHLALYSANDLRKVVHYFSEVKEDIVLKEQDEKAWQELKREWENSYHEDGLDFEHFSFKFKRKKDRYTKYRQDLSLATLQDLMDYLATTRGTSEGFKHVMRQSLTTLQDESERWHRDLIKQKAMSAPENHWTPRFEHPLIFFQQSAKEPTKGHAVEFKELCTGAELAQEGREQRHCVGSYVSRCKQGQTRIVSMRTYDVIFADPSSWESYYFVNHFKRVLTIELTGDDARGWRAIQVKGRANRPATSAENAMVNKWLRSYNSAYPEELNAA